MLRAWLQLFRVPNLLTVPGDPLAGFLIATGGRLDERVVPAILASLCFYAAGLAMNDLADMKEDQQERPGRPLASGRISKGAAGLATLLLIGIAIVFLRTTGQPAALVGGALLIGTVSFYNLLAKRIAFVGAITMGACRTLSLFIGASVGAGSDPLWSEFTMLLGVFDPLLAASLVPFAIPRGQMLFSFAVAGGFILGLYIAAVTALARHEAQPEYPKLARFLPLAAALLGYLALKQATGPLLRDQSPTLWLLGIVLCAMNTNQLMRQPPPPLPPRIGSFIRVLPVFQAALCLAPSVPSTIGKTPASLLCGLCLLACVPLHAWLGKRYYAS